MTAAVRAPTTTRRRREIWTDIGAPHDPTFRPKRAYREDRSVKAVEPRVTRSPNYRCTAVNPSGGLTELDAWPEPYRRCGSAGSKPSATTATVKSRSLASTDHDWTTDDCRQPARVVDGRTPLPPLARGGAVSSSRCGRVRPTAWRWAGARSSYRARKAACRCGRRSRGRRTRRVPRAARRGGGHPWRWVPR